MKRDLNAARLVRSYAPRTAAGFTQVVESIANAYEPSPTAIAELDRMYKSTAEHLAECEEFQGLMTDVFAQGSRQLGTIIRPVQSDDEGFDVDLVSFFSAQAEQRYGGPDGPRRLSDVLFKVMDRYATRHGLGIHRWERCVTLEYAGGTRADYVAAISNPAYALTHGEHHALIPDRKLQRYLPTNPKGFCLSFDEVAKRSPSFRRLDEVTAMYEAMQKSADVAPLPPATEVLGRMLCRFVQLLKIHRNVAFGKVVDGADFKPTSVFLTRLAQLAYAAEAPNGHDGPLDLFMDMVELMPHLFERVPLSEQKEHWVLKNPTAHNDNMAESMNTPERQRAFLKWHEKLRGDVQRLVDALEGREGMDTVVRIIEESFGARAGNSLISHGATQREHYRSLRQAGFVVAGTMPAVTPARAHTYCGG